MAAVVIIGDGYVFRIEAHHRNQPNKSKLCCISCYFHFSIPFKWLYTSKKMEHFSYKGGCGGRGCIHIKAQ